MPAERENISSILTPADYDIGGNALRAYYDARHKLVFVIDYALNEDKPNVLLVLNPAGDRKWDDILANDYGIDLETVRPKKDNKYQKLDIEYGGLGVYDELINRFDAGEDIDAELDALRNFRNASVRRAAAERLESAEVIAANTRETILKTDDAIDELQTKIRELKSKLTRQRRDVGREPTKQSAAKILRTEAQIDAANEKMRRAKKRLSNARRRLVAAEDDAGLARGLLERIPVADAAASRDIMTMPANEVAVVEPTPTEIAPTEIALTKSASMFSDVVSFDAPAPESQTESKERAENMAEEEVKPLFDKDPEILDEEIAFKPIDFDVSSVSPVPSERAVADPARASDAAPAPTAFNENFVEQAPVPPMSFTPPTDANDTAAPAEEPLPINVAPVLDSITAVEPANPADARATELIPQPIVTPRAEPTAAPAVAPAPAASNVRPVSPITGPAPTAAPARGRPTLLYYVMLILLIIMSIFTLWLYQKSTSDTIPDLTARTPAAPVAENAEPAAPMVTNDNPFIAAEPVAVAPVAAVEVVETVETAPVVDAVPAEPEPAPMPEPATQYAQPDDIPAAPVADEVAPTTIAPVSGAAASDTDAAIPEPVVTTLETEAVVTAPATDEPVVNKPAYSVSHQDKMFVSASEYNDENVVASDDAGGCANGGAPDMYGCCPGETFTDMGGGSVACCADGECFPPML